jgi:Peptidase family M50
MKFNRKVFIDSFLGLIVGGVLIYLGYISIKEKTLFKFLPNDSILQNVTFFTSIVIAPFLAIALHELGHLIAGIFQGFRLELYVVGFFGLKRVEDKIKVYFNTNAQYFGGVAATSPKKILSDSELIRKYKIILISGPLFSLIFGIIPLFGLYYSNSMLKPFLALLGITSLGVFFVTTIPSRSGIFFTDRKRYQRLNDKGETGQIELAFLQIVNQSLLENNCKNLPLERINKLKTDNDKVIQFWGHYFEYQHYKDNGNLAGADTVKYALENYKQLMPKSIWKSLQID